MTARWPGEVRLRAQEGGTPGGCCRRWSSYCASLALRPSDLDGFAVTTGPGSFTGLRVGLAPSRAWRSAAGLPCVGLCTLDVLAATLAGRADCLVAMMDAYRGQVFGALYDRAARLVSDRVAEDPRAFVERLPARPLVIGDGAWRYREVLQQQRPEAEVVSQGSGHFLAGTLGLLAAPRIAAGQGQAPGELRPLYLRGADIRPPVG